MKNLFRTITQIVLVSSVLLISSPSSALTAQQIVKKYARLYQPKEAVLSANMVVAKPGGEFVRSFIFVSKEYPQDLNKTLIRVIHPENIRGMGLLILENEDGPNDVWFYLTSLEKSKKIITGEQAHNLMDSDFAYEDFRGEVVGRFEYRLLGFQYVERKKCFLIEATPTFFNDTQYGRRMLWIRKGRYNKVKEEFYDKNGGLMKTAIYKDAYSTFGKKFKSMSITMLNHQRGSKSVLSLTFSSVKYRIPDSTFTIENLEGAFVY